MMDKFFKIPILYDYYGEFLTTKQKQAIDFYYNLNYSLAEIGEKMGITRQGVRDILVRSEETLYNFDKKLKLVDKFEKINIIIDELLLDLTEVEGFVKEETCIRKINKIKSHLKDLLEEN